MFATNIRIISGQLFKKFWANHLIYKQLLSSIVFERHRIITPFKMLH